MELEKNLELDVDIQDLSSDGYGVAKPDGMVVFVPYTLPGERWNIRIIKTTAKYAVGKAIKRISKESSDRAEAVCPVYRSCGGCQVMHLTYQRQLAFKEQNLRQCFLRSGMKTMPEIKPIIGMEDPWRYRNKGLFPFALLDGKPECGLYAEHSHRLVPTCDCMIQNDSTVAVMNAVRKWARDYSVEPYREENHSGTLRYVMSRTSLFGETMAVVVTRTEKLPHSDELIRILRSEVPDITSVYQNVNEDFTNVALGKVNRLLWGKETIRERIGDAVFMLSPESFFQVNPVMTEKLYALVNDATDVSEGDVLFDAYCGVGTIGQYCAKGKKIRLYGVEYVRKAVEDARRNSILNGITDTRYVTGKAEEIMTDLAEKGLRPDVVIIDPPRKGCHEAFLGAVETMLPKRLVYVSCNPATLARDMEILCRKTFAPVWVQPVDMFPHTTGVESVALLVRKENRIGL